MNKSNDFNLLQQASNIRRTYVGVAMALALCFLPRPIFVVLHGLSARFLVLALLVKSLVDAVISFMGPASSIV